MADIGELPKGVLRTLPKFGLREEIEFVPVFTPSKQRHKRNFTVVFLQVVKKSAPDVKICFHLLFGPIAIAVTVAFVVAPRIY